MSEITPKYGLRIPAAGGFTQATDIQDSFRKIDEMGQEHNADGTHKVVNAEKVVTGEVVADILRLPDGSVSSAANIGGTAQTLAAAISLGAEADLGTTDFALTQGGRDLFRIDAQRGLAGMIGNINDPLVQIPFRRANDETRLSGVQTYICASGSKYIDPLDGLLKAAAIDTPRCVRIPDGVSGIGLLHEGTGTTNLIPAASYNLAAGWVAHSVTASSIAQDAVGLDGVANSAVTITDTDSANAAARRTLINTITADTATYAFSIYVKKITVAGSTSKIVAYMTGGTAIVRTINFDPFTGAQDAASQAYSYVEDEGAYWRVTQTVVNNLNTVARIIVYPSVKNTVDGAVDVTLTGSIVVDHPQIELKEYSTSPVTGGSTRARSMLTIAASGNDVRAGDDYTMVMGIYILGSDIYGRIIDGSDADFWVGIENSGTPQFRCKLHSTAALGVSAATSPPTPRAIMEIAVRVSGGVQSFWIDGVNVASNAIAQSGINNTLLGIGNLDDSSSTANSDLIIKNLRIYDRALTDSEVAAA